MNLFYIILGFIVVNLVLLNKTSKVAGLFFIFSPIYFFIVTTYSGETEILLLLPLSLLQCLYLIKSEIVT